MQKNFLKVHQAGLRARYKLQILKDKFIDEDILKNYFLDDENIQNSIESIRVNKKAYSIVFELNENIFESIEKKLETLSLNSLLTSIDGVNRINPIIPINAVISAILNNFSSVISMLF